MGAGSIARDVFRMTERVFKRQHRAPWVPEQDHRVEMNMLSDLIEIEAISDSSVPSSGFTTLYLARGRNEQPNERRTATNRKWLVLKTALFLNSDGHQFRLATRVLDRCNGVFRR